MIIDNRNHKIFSYFQLHELTRSATKGINFCARGYLHSKTRLLQMEAQAAPE